MNDPFAVLRAELDERRRARGGIHAAPAVELGAHAARVRCPW